MRHGAVAGVLGAAAALLFLLQCASLFWSGRTLSNTWLASADASPPARKPVERHGAAAAL